MIVGRAKVGRYDVERHVASGGMAEVYQARDPATGRCVALKIPHGGEEIWEAERTGAALQIELSNRDSRVPRVYEIGEGDERFVAMEYVEGEDLSRRLQDGPLEWREATAVAIELCGVLATARSCGAPSGEPGGIVHGDIKPRNIRIQERGRIKVLDFGIAKALRRTRAETRNLFGSVPYSSPERLDRGHVDYHSDLWSVAVVLYEMLEGRPPFHAATEPELERAIRSGATPAPLEGAIPAEFQALLGKALARALSDRYASAQELENDLRAVLRTGAPGAALGGAPLITAPGVPAGEAPASGPDATPRTRDEANGSPDPDATRRTGPADDAGLDPDATRRTGSAGEAGLDPDATRRTAPAPPAADADEATRRTASATGAASAAGRVAEEAPPSAPRASYAQASEPSAAPSTAPAAHAADASARPGGVGAGPWLLRVRWRVVAVFVMLIITAREIQAFGSARDLRSTLASRPRGDAAAVWSDYRRVMRGHVLVYVSGLRGAVREWMVSHADDLISRNRSDTPTIYEAGWRTAEALLQRAAMVDPGNRRIQARLEFCRGHLLRLAARDAKQGDDSVSGYDEAASRFERATRLWPGWGDPYIGLAQIYAYGKRDPELTSDALERARKAHYPFGERETALLGDAYRLRAERRWAGPTGGFDVDQHYRHLDRVRDDCVHALEQYELVPSYAGVSRHLRTLRQRLAEIDRQQGELSGEPAMEGDVIPPESSIP